MCTSLVQSVLLHASGMRWFCSHFTFKKTGSNSEPGLFIINLQTKLNKGIQFYSKYFRLIIPWYQQKIRANWQWAFVHIYWLSFYDVRAREKSPIKQLLCFNSKLKVLRLNGNFLQNPHPEWFVTVVQHPPIKDNSLTSFVSNNDWKCNCASAEYQVR